MILVLIFIICDIDTCYSFKIYMIPPDWNIKLPIVRTASNSISDDLWENILYDIHDDIII